VGADAAQELVPILIQLQAEGKGGLISYSVEVDAAKAAGKASVPTTSAAAHKTFIEEYIRSVDVAGDFEDKRGTPFGGRRTWVPLKLVRLVKIYSFIGET
jgi:hypothetical protein